MYVHNEHKHNSDTGCFECVGVGVGQGLLAVHNINNEADGKVSQYRDLRTSIPSVLFEHEDLLLIQHEAN